MKKETESASVTGGGQMERGNAFPDAASALDTIRLERLAVRGLGAEATAISSARVRIDRLRKTYTDWNPFDAESSREFEAALMAVIGAEEARKDAVNG